MAIRSVVLFAVMAISVPASAQDLAARAAPPDQEAFGSNGQIAIAVDLPLRNSAPQLTFVHESVSMGGPSANAWAIQPSADYFVMRNLSIGGLIGIAHATESLAGTNTDTTVVTVEGRVGYNVPLADVFSIWPRIAIGYAHADGGGVSQNIVPLALDVPILWHPASHFFFGAGFVISTQLSNNTSAGGTSTDQPKTTDIGVDLTIGGYLGGR